MLLFLLVLALQEEVQVKEDDFARIKPKVESYEKASADYRAGRAQAALQAVRAIARAPIGHEEKIIVVTRRDRQFRRWKEIARHDYFPFTLGAECLLSLASREGDRSKRLKLLEEAQALVNRSRAPRADPVRQRVTQALTDARSTGGEDPSAAVIREVNRLQGLKEFKAAFAALEKNRSLLGDGYAGLRAEVDKRRKQVLSELNASAGRYLEEIRPDEKLQKLENDLKSFLPDPGKVGSVGPDLEWVQALTEVVQKYRKHEYFENVRSPDLDRELSALEQDAVHRESLPQAGAALAIRMNVAEARIKGEVAAARSDPLDKLDAHQSRVDNWIKPFESRLKSLKNAREPSLFLKKYLERFEASLSDLRRPDLRPPVAEPKVSEISAVVETGAFEIYGPEGQGSYRGVIAKVQGLLGSDAFSRWHPEEQARGRSIFAALLALEGFHRGQTPDQIRDSCRAYVDGGFRHVLTVPSKVRKLLDSCRP